jgi:Asp-tRNA(Asn)/Glu-tRNA(Gln) amidotransferase A subunit family amidase
MPHLIPDFPRTASDIHQAIVNGTMTARDSALQTIAVIERSEPEIHAWKVFDPQSLLDQADQIDRLRAAGHAPGLLAGVPLAVKDILDTADFPTEYGSAIYQGHRPKRDAHIVDKARRAGALVAGKTVTTEFAYFSPGPTANPWNLSHTPGGSSSGSAAAVASGMVPLAFGTQTAGSLIRPASYCGVFALKPTFGLFSTEGAKAFAPSLDTLGWLANTAEDLELMRCALASLDFEPLPIIAPAALRLGSCLTFEGPSLEASGVSAWEEAHRRIANTGVDVATITMPIHLEGLMQAQKTVMAYEAARTLVADVKSHPDQLSAQILELARTGAAISIGEYRQAQALIAQGRLEVTGLLDGIDALLVPAAPGEAPAGLAATGDPLFSRVWTALGLPCVNVPGILGPNQLPVGMQLVGRLGEERGLLTAAAALHRSLSKV